MENRRCSYGVQMWQYYVKRLMNEVQTKVIDAEAQQQQLQQQQPSLQSEIVDAVLLRSLQELVGVYVHQVAPSRVRSNQYRVSCSPVTPFLFFLLPAYPFLFTVFFFAEFSVIFRAD